MYDILLALSLTVVAGLATAIGAAFVFLKMNRDRMFLSFSLGYRRVL